MPSLIDRTRLLAQRTRQHHAIEHATLHLLAAQFPRRSFAGVSDPLGFTIYGDVNEETLRRAVSDALLRLQAGEVLATGAAWLGLAGRRPGIDKFGAAVALVVVALVIAQPLGMRLQAFTTSAAVADRWVAQIRPIQTGALAGHRVVFE
jgi:hypothetical protein